MTRKILPEQLALFVVSPDGKTVQPTFDLRPPDVRLSDEVRELRSRINVLETWVEMLAGTVTNDFTAIPSLDEAALKELSERATRGGR